MCGICGVLRKSAQDKIDSASIEKMLRSIVQRGPDAKGYFIDNNISLASQRLKVIDFENGRQPMSNEDESVWLVFNGEIYNFLELRKMLESKGHLFKSGSDTETIVHLYEEEGLEFVKKIKGMFALAIWDKNKKRLILARDRFGIKPLYYFYSPDMFIFASEPKAILCYPEFDKEIEPLALDSYLSMEYVASPHSIFKNIYKLPAAHILIFADNTVKLSEYWRIEPDCSYQSITEEEAQERLLYFLTDSVKGHSRSDAPLGFFLSGGVDSSSLLAIYRTLYKNSRIKSYSVGFHEESFDESAYAKKVSNIFCTEHKHILFAAQDVKNIMPELSSFLDEPFADASILPAYLLSRISSQEITVAISGDGSDEIFAGYPTYQAHKFLKYYSLVPIFIRDKIIKNLVNRLPVSHRNFSLDFMLKKFVSFSDRDNTLARHLNWMGSFSEAEKISLYSDEFKEKLCKKDKLEALWGDCSSFVKDVVTQAQLIDARTYLTDDILVKTDRASMINSQEVRVPYLDHELVKFVFSLPKQLRMKGFAGKYILKQLMKRYLPRQIVFRRKKGFGIPLAFWINTCLRDYVLDMLSQERIKKLGFLNYRHVQKILDEHFEKKVDNRKKIWTLFMLSVWHQEYMENKL